jgi:hypothetical protein
MNKSHLGIVFHDQIFDEIVIVKDIFESINKNRQTKLLAHLGNVFPGAEIRVAEVLNYGW